ncbi:hypothetical protein SAMN05216505_12227 [Streptomyces prasinopilosus]|uniref:Uncharacterized protein n=1 Tax=Streptomyces prasinopilosus TaxID=67344 RepID=A0A1G7BBP5_9ACTN|nr:hypothetical protein SAMN05216505_12227 [Streptomyces prasinopilosus]
MRLAGAHAAVRRIWTVELRARAGGPSLVCAHCTTPPPPLRAASARSAALAHLARHARAGALPGYLRTCQCREQGCSWHPRHRGCAGPVLLALTLDSSGRAWRLADACTACVAATSRTAVVPDTLLASRRPRRPRCSPAPLGGPVERGHVRATLAHLAVAVPQSTSPGARLLALQCALRADASGHVQLPGGLLRGMRLCGRGELWEELEYAGWLRRMAGRHPQVAVYLLDTAALFPQPDNRARARAAQWALHPAPLTVPTGLPPAVRLTALALASHTSGSTERGDMSALARLCGHSPQQTAELLDRLVAAQTLAGWRHDWETDEVFWQLPSAPRTGHSHRPTDDCSTS